MNDILHAKVIKRSVRIAGHMTSVSLEAPYWALIQDIAKAEGRSLSDLITDIDSRRGTNLSSALRLYALDVLQRKLLK